MTAIFLITTVICAVGWIKNRISVLTISTFLEKKNIHPTHDSLTGCAKCISTETSIVQVKVVDKYYRVEHRTPVYNGKTTMWVTSPAVYSITVEYEDNQYTVSGGTTYNKYSNRIGEYVNGTLQIRKYDNGSVKCKIVGLE